MNELYLMHYGVGHDENPPGRGSGRYAYGTGENPGQHQESFRDTVKRLRAEGLTDKQICEFMNIPSTEFRALVTVNRAIERNELARRAMNYKDKGMSTTAIGEKMGIPESTVRNLINPIISQRTAETIKVADAIKKEVAEKGYIDVGTNVNISMDISEQKLINVVRYLQLEEGYVVATPRVEQFGTGKKTTIKVIAPPGTDPRDIYNAAKELDPETGMPKIQLMEGWHKDYVPETGEEVLKPLHKPVNMDADRVKVRYSEEGGIDKDGVMELRPGVEDLSLGASQYAQVRIGVKDKDGNKAYLKGMAVYGDPKDFPDGVDVIFNTNKHVGTPKMPVGEEKGVLKAQTKDENNPFKAAISRQNDWVDINGKEHEGPINIVRDEGAWKEYNNTVSSQFLSKQPYKLAKQQLDLMYASKKQEFDDICALENPVIKRKLLDDFADQCDSDAVHLRAASFPRQGHHVLLPVTSLKENEVYAPRFKEGETVVLVRFPHASRAEIPELTVTHHNKEAERFMKNAVDAVGINPKVAGQLSGADFDGDTVLVIPNPHTSMNRTTKKTEGAIKVEAAIPELRSFEPKEVYKGYSGMKVMTPHQTQLEMGKVSNLITDMTIKGATRDELIPVIKHSMVVIDAEKHELDWKASEADNHIKYYKQKYQQHADDDGFGGAQTLISRSKGEIRVDERKQYFKTDPETGEKISIPTGRMITRRNKKGEVTKVEPATTTSTQMYEAKDARELISKEGSQIEEVYANFANQMKALGNASRKEYLNTGKIVRNPEKTKEYANEVASLNSKLLQAKKNAPLERQAHALANAQLAQQKKDNPGMTKADIKKAKGKLLQPARRAVGAHKTQIQITDKEWEAIQAGALSDNKVMEIFNNSDSAKIKERATPRSRQVISSGKRARIVSLLKQGYSLDQIASFAGVSSSSVGKIKLEEGITV